MKLAYVPSIDDEEDKVLQTEGTGDAGGFFDKTKSQVGTSGQVQTTAAPSQSAAQQNQLPTNYGGSAQTIANVNGGSRNRPSSSGSFTNYQRYIEALSPQSQRLAKQLTDIDYRKAAEQYGTQLSGAQDVFTEKVGTAPVFNKGLINQAVGNTMNFLTDADKVAALEALRTASYGGPMSLQQAGLRGDLEASQAEAVKRAQELNTSAGRDSLLGGLEGYAGTRGQRLLDKYLLDYTPAAQQVFANYGGRVQTGLQGQLDTAAQIAKDRAEQMKAATEKVREMTQSGLTKGVEKVAGESEADITGRTNALKMQLLKQNGNLSADQIKAAGMTPKEYQDMMSALKLAKDPNTGRPYGTLFDALANTNFVEQTMRLYAGKNPYSRRWLNQVGLTNADPEDVIKFLAEHQGADYGKLRRPIPTMDYGNYNDITVAGQKLGLDPYMLAGGSVGATPEQIARYNALQKIAGVAEPNYAALTGQSDLINSEAARLAALQREAQQSSALSAEQKRRAVALNDLLRLGQNFNPKPSPWGTVGTGINTALNTVFGRSGSTTPNIRDLILQAMIAGRNQG